jgi:hypothetical protein
VVAYSFLAIADHFDPAVLRYFQNNNLEVEPLLEVAGLIGSFRVRFNDGYFDLDDSGESAICHIVYADDAETPCDVLAWSMHRPNRFGVFRGASGILGVDQVLNPATYYGGKPCRLWSTPLKWLHAGCQGAVVLDGALATTILQGAPGRLAAESRVHAAELTRDLPLVFRAKPVLIPRCRRAA